MAEYMYCTSAYYQSAGTLFVSNTSAPFFNYFAPSAQVTAGQSYSSDSETFKTVIDSLEGWADAFFRRIKYHTPANGHLSEEFNRDTGVPQGAVDLTWSYASVLTASFARAGVNGDSSFIKSLANFGY